MRGWVGVVERKIIALLRSARDDDALVLIGLFVGSVLVNGIVAIVLIGWLQALGIWGPEAAMPEWRPLLPSRPASFRYGVPTD